MITFIIDAHQQSPLSQMLPNTLSRHRAFELASHQARQKRRGPTRPGRAVVARRGIEREVDGAGIGVGEIQQEEVRHGRVAAVGEFRIHTINRDFAGTTAEVMGGVSYAF